MLEVKDLVKSYSAKGGATVIALNGVSVKFPEKGMVFLLGKSGSGKSTLLNIAGGLDRPDSGEIIVKGKSSKNFSPSDFDSYRNTLVGFVFQEYNILNEFTVEQNIALALQLQGKPCDKKAVDALLEKVGLSGYGKRKPNTLSGGQKQRVAIARALIKEPEIIMADEPTGALDSVTGRQVLDTLKELSATKLVVVVSHDREFAEFYGDRIIELQDGKIIFDVSKERAEPKQFSQNVKLLGDDTISISDASSITDDDVKAIVDMLKSRGGEAIISANGREMPKIKRACKISGSGNREYFKDTGEVETAEYDGSQTKFIKSRLPLSRAVKMGAAGLKTKPIRLIFTVFLAVVAFIMFGVVSTFMLYDPNYSVAEAMRAADYPSLTVSKYYDYLYQSVVVAPNGSERVDSETHRMGATRFGVQELQNKNSGGNGNFAGIFNFTNQYNSSTVHRGAIMLLRENSALPASPADPYYSVSRFYGFTDCGEKYMRDNGFILLKGAYPADKTQIALPEYMAELFVNTAGSGIEQAADMVGKQIIISGVNAIPANKAFTVSGVYNVGNIPQKYDALKGGGAGLSADGRRELTDSLEDYLAYGYNTILYVTEDFYEEYKGGTVTQTNTVNSTFYRGVMLSPYTIADIVSENSGNSYYTDKTVATYPDTFKFYDLDGNEKDYSASDEAYISETLRNNLLLDNYVNLGIILQSRLYKYDDRAYGLFGPESDFSQKLKAANSIYGEDYAYVKGAVEKWYATLAQREFNLTYAANELKNGFDFYGERDKYSSFTAASDRAAEAVKDGAENHSVDGGDWEIIENTVNELKGIEKYNLYFTLAYAQEMFDNAKTPTLKNLLNAAADGDFEGLLNAARADSRNGVANGQIQKAVNECYAQITGRQPGSADRYSSSVDFKIYYKDYRGQNGELQAAGYFSTGATNYTHYLLSSAFLAAHAVPEAGGNEYYTRYKTGYTEPNDAKYNYIITLTHNTQQEIAAALGSGGNAVYKLTNRVYGSLESFLGLITNMQTPFLISGLVVGVFAALMLLNFISASISAKQRDIGILRAVGARGSDIFKIFSFEALIIALICFALASVGALIVCMYLNTIPLTAVSVKLLNFNFINVLLIFAISIAVSLLATFFPVYFASKKAPVDSIRSL